MEEIQRPTKEELYKIKAGRLGKRYEEIHSGAVPYSMKAWIGFQIDELLAAYHAPDEETAKEHFCKSAEAALVFLSFLFENQDDRELLKREVDRSEVNWSNSATVLEGIQAAFAGGDFELARRIAEKADLPWHRRNSHGQAHRYALALVKLVLKNDYSGFKEIKPERNVANFGYIGEVWRTVETNPRKALEMTEVLIEASKKAEKELKIAYESYSTTAYAIRGWIKYKYPEITESGEVN